MRSASVRIALESSLDDEADAVASSLGSLRDAISTLEGGGASVSVLLPGKDDPSPSFLVHGDASWTVRASWRVSLRVDGAPPPVRASDEWGWRDVLPGLRIAVLPTPGSPLSVRRYCLGWAVEEEEEGAPDAPCLADEVAVCVDTRGRVSFDDSATDEGAHAFADALLDVRRASRLARFSAVVRALWARAGASAAWRRRLSLLWRGGHPLRDVPDAALPLSDGGALLREIRFDPDLDVLGLTALRRMQTPGTSRTADVRASALSELAIGRVVALPVRSARLARLHSSRVVRVGLLGEGWRVVGGSPYGVLVERGDDVSPLCLAVPSDCDAGGMALALASLLPLSERVDEAAEGEVVPLPFGRLLCEPPNPRSDPREAGGGWHATWVDWGEDGLSLVPSGEPLDVPSLVRAPWSADELARAEAAPTARARRVELAARFPLVCARLTAHEASTRRCLEACVREVQARRVACEWTLEAFDRGGNLSRVGMCTLLALLLDAWMGLRARVLLGPCGAALVQAWLDDGVVAVVDASHTHANAFDLHGGGGRAAVLAAPSRLPRVGQIVQVRRGRAWRSALVREMRLDMDAARVECLRDGACKLVHLHGHAWRIPPSDDAELCEAVGLLVRRARREVSVV